MTTMLQSLVDRVRNVDPDDIELPILRDLVKDAQSKSPAELQREGSAWTDTNWSQWKQHTSHNPW